MANYAIEIAELESIVNSAIASTSTDGVSVSQDLVEAKKRLNELYILDHDSRALARPVMTATRLGGAW